MHPTYQEEAPMNELIERGIALQTKIATALVRQPPLTAAECRELGRELAPVARQVEARYELIRTGKGGRPGGDERVRILRTGSLADAQALNAETEQVGILLDQMRAQEQGLSDRQRRARVDEAVHGLPRLQQELVEKLAAAEAAKEALDSAMEALEASVAAVTQARSVAKNNLLETASASLGTVRRIEALNASLQSIRNPLAHPAFTGQDLRDSIGCERPKEPDVSKVA